MKSEDLNKSFSESTRALAKAFLILAFETFDTVQKISSQTQEFIQDLVAEAKSEQAANSSKTQNVEPFDKNVEESATELVGTAGREEDSVEHVSAAQDNNSNIPVTR